jgi:hypothetical protein
MWGIANVRRMCAKYFGKSWTDIYSIETGQMESKVYCVVREDFPDEMLFEQGPGGNKGASAKAF